MGVRATKLLTEDGVNKILAETQNHFTSGFYYQVKAKKWTILFN